MFFLIDIVSQDEATANVIKEDVTLPEAAATAVDITTMVFATLANSNTINVEYL